MNQNSQTKNADDLIAQEIELYKSRVYFLNKELENCGIYPNRINLLIQLSAAVTALLMLESNQQASKVKGVTNPDLYPGSSEK